MKQKTSVFLAALVASSVNASDIVITEIMQNPSAVSDGSGEWIEILNTGSEDLNLKGWSFSDNDSDSFNIESDLIVKAGTYSVLGNNAIASTNGGVTVDYEYSGMFLSNSSDELVITSDTAVEMDRVEWDNGNTFPDPNGASMVLIDASTDNSLGESWTTSSTSYGDGDFGTPGSGPDGLSNDTEEPETPEGEVVSSSNVFINEIHYDNAGSDVGESFEVAGVAGVDLSGLSVVLYNGSNASVYNTIALSGVIPEQQMGFGSIAFSLPSNGLQNGSPDGLALVDAEGNVIQFLSYEGAFEAANGPAVGMTSTDIGVSETSSTPIGTSLQLVGAGYRYQDFTWQTSEIESFGNVNSLQTFVSPDPFINEIHYDNAGSDSGEGIEIAALAGTDLTGFSVVLYNGNNASVYNTIALSGVIPELQAGFGTLPFLLPSNGLQNGSPDGLALVDAENNVLQFLSYEGEFEAANGPAAGMTSTDIGVAESGGTPVGYSLQLSGNGTAYGDFIWSVAAANTFGLVNTDQVFGVGGDGGTGGSGGEGGNLGTCADSATKIHNIQGTSDVSPVLGETHIVQGVVTASFENLDGFFMQEEDAQRDTDLHTSEGIFVFYTGALPSEGSVVRVQGVIEEFFNKTQIKVSSSLVDCGSAAVTAMPLSLPFSGAQDSEALEGMLVASAQELVVTNNFQLGRFGEVTLSSERLYKATNLHPAGSPEAIALATQNTLNQIILDDGVNGQNPATVIYPTGNLSASNTLRGGDTVSALTGVMDYSFGKYRIIPTQAPSFVQTNERSNAPDLALGNVKIASLNVLNYFNTIDDSGSICGPSGNMGCRGADSALEFSRQKAKTVAALVVMDADIVGLMEIENNGTGVGSAIQDLVAGVNVEVGEGTYTALSAGSSIGSDAISVALIYKSSVVTPSGALAILTSDNSIADDNGPLFNDGKNRPSIAQKFALVENAEELVVSVSHLKSKGSSCGTGDDDTTTGQGNCNLTRTRAAQALTAFLDSKFPDMATLILGDLNAYAKEDPILAIEQNGYTNLINYFNGADAYSYVFDGEFGYLDHALGNNKALAKVVDVTEWHINADEPISLDYNTEFKSEQQIIDFYADDVYRMSDHDPVLISLQLDAPVSNQTSADVNQDGNIDFSDYFAILGFYGSALGDANFNPIADYDGDTLISPLDLQAWYQLYLSQ